MFSRSPKTSIWNKMEGVARKIFVRMFIPAVIVGVWTYAQLESVRARAFVSMWKEGGIVRVGNPYTAPLPRRSEAPPSATDQPGDEEIEGTATANGGF